MPQGGGAATAAKVVRYLILTDEDQIPHAQKLVEGRYSVIPLSRAMNGALTEIYGHEVLLWPSAIGQEIDRMRQFAMQLVDECPIVKFLDTSLPMGNIATPQFCAENNWSFAAFKEWANLTFDGRHRLQVISASTHVPVNVGSPESGPPSVADSLPESPVDPAPPLEAYADEFQPPSGDDQPESKPSHWQRPELRPSAPFAFPEHPADFWTETKPPVMRHEWMPAALADYFSHESETRGSDPGIFWGFGTGICAGSLSDSVKVRVKPDDPHWLQSARLWIAIAGDSGDNKSPVLTAILRPLRDLEQQLMEQATRAIDQYQDDHEAYEQQRKRYITAKADGKITKADGKIIERPDAPERPCRNRLIVKNSTLAGLRTVLQDQADRGILEVHDELAGLFTGADQFKAKGGNDLQERLLLWDGGYHSFDLEGRLIGIKNWSTSIVGGTQPNKIRSVVAKMGLSDDGSIQRFNFYLTRHAELDMERPAHDGHKLFADIVGRLYEIQHQGPVDFSPEAHAIRREFFVWAHEQRQRPWINGALKSHIAKFGNFFARFCMTYHAIECAAQHSAFVLPVISEKIASQIAALLKDCLYPHAEALYCDVLDTNGELLTDVRYLAEKLLAKGIKTFNLTWVAQNWTKWRTFKPWQKKGILTMLAEGGWLHSKDPRGYVEGMSYSAAVHPGLQVLFPRYVQSAQRHLEDMEELRKRKMQAHEAGSD